MTQYPILVWTSSAGQEFDLNPEDLSVVLNRLEGLGEVLVDMQTTRAPYQDGATWIDSPLEPRDVRIRVHLFANSRLAMAALRNDVVSAFNPKLGPGILRYQTAVDSPNRILIAVPDGVPVFPSEQVEMGHQECEIALRALDPYWLADEDSGQEIPVNDEDVVTNVGHVDCPVKIIITGPATDPIIRNKTEDDDTFIQWIGTVDENKTLTITTGFQNKRALLDGTNVLGKITLLSTFWWLFPGQNLVGFEADDTGPATGCRIEWRPRYVGI